MSRHATAEALSAYLDEELPEGPTLALVRHLEDCDECRTRLASIRRVVTCLSRLERSAPPPVLEQDVVRRIALSSSPRGRLERLEDRMRSFPRLPSMFSTFSLVVALAVIVYLFSAGVERLSRGRTALVVVSPHEEISLELANGRRFDRRGGVWIEQGIDLEAPRRAVKLGSNEGRELALGLESLDRLDPPILLWVAGEVVALTGR